MCNLLQVISHAAEMFPAQTETPAEKQAFETVFGPRESYIKVVNSPVCKQLCPKCGLCHYPYDEL